MARLANVHSIQQEAHNQHAEIRRLPGRIPGGRIEARQKQLRLLHQGPVGGEKVAWVVHGDIEPQSEALPGAWNRAGRKLHTC